MTYNVQYYILLDRILKKGTYTEDRTGQGHLKIFDHTMTYNVGDRGKYMKYHLPLLRLRKIHPRIAFEELHWMLRGSTDVTELQEKNVHIWDLNSSRGFLDKVGLKHIRENNIGRAYGYQFRNSNGIDQLDHVYLDLLCGNHHRRHIIDLWNTADLKEMALPPCVYSYQFVPVGDTLHLKVIQRSCDVILGQPTNAMFASFFLAIMASQTGMQIGTVSHTMVDVHIYSNHIEAAKTMISRYEEWMDNPKKFDPTIMDDLECDLDSLFGLYKKTDDIALQSIDRALWRIDYELMGVPKEYESLAPIDKSKLIMAV